MIWLLPFPALWSGFLIGFHWHSSISLHRHFWMSSHLVIFTIESFFYPSKLTIYGTRRVARGGDKPECPPVRSKKFCLPSYYNNVDGIRPSFKWYSIPTISLLLTERNKTLNYMPSMLTEVARVSTIQFWSDELIDVSCWLTALDQKNTYHLSNRYT